MSRYEVDKVLRRIVLDEAERERFLKDPSRFLEGPALTEEELRALTQRDYAALYALGAHPFLLWGWACQVSGGDMLSSVGLAREFVEAVKPYGYPDFAT